MKNLYLIKSETNNINFDCDKPLGLHFIESAVDISFLDNVLIDNKLKLQIQQDIQENGKLPGKACIWFIVLSDKGYSNASLEEELAFVKNVGNQLHQITKLGLRFSYKDIYSLPNIPDTWDIADISVNLSNKGPFKEVFCVDRTKEVRREGDISEYAAEAKHIKSDLAFCVGSDNQQTQAQFIHIVTPSNNIKIDSSGLRTAYDVEPLKKLYDMSLYRSDIGIIFELYHDAITSGNILSSFVTLFQIIEIIIGIPSPTTLQDEVIESIVGNLNSNDIIDKDFRARLSGLLRGIKKETSRELLSKGLRTLLGDQLAENIDIQGFSSWRKFRGKLTHPKKAQEITDIKFVEQYKTLRIFSDELISGLQEKLEQDFQPKQSTKSD